MKTWSLELDWREVDSSSSLPTLRKLDNNIREIGLSAGRVLEVDFVGDGGGIWRKFTCLKRR